MDYFHEKGGLPVSCSIVCTGTGALRVDSNRQVASVSAALV